MSNEITGTNSYIPPTSQADVFQVEQSKVETSSAETSQQRAASNEDIDFNGLIQEDPELKALFDRLAGVADQIEDKGTTFSMKELIQALIEITQTLQLMATANAARLSIDTKLMSAYADQKASISNVKEGDVNYKNDSLENRNNYNMEMGLERETIDAKKGEVEDEAKRVQTLMQGSKDAGESFKDFTGSFIDLLRGISQKINR